MEDLVEELVGDITDEYDVVVEERVSVRGDLLVDGLTTLDEFAEKTGLVLPEGPYDTLAGFFMAQLGQLPGVGDEVEVELAAADPDDERRRPGSSCEVTELDGRRASDFVVRRLDRGRLHTRSQTDPVARCGGAKFGRGPGSACVEQ